MERQCFLIKGVRYGASDVTLQAALEQIYNTNESPYCMCRPGGVQMYVAKYSQYVIKRLPETGHAHHPSCPSYELPPSESGLGELIGEAVIERDAESVELRTAFPLTRVHGRSIQRGEGDPASDVQASRHALSLRAMVHWLWERAGINRWYPTMKGRRHWATVRKHVLEHAHHVRTKGCALSDVLLLPEPFNLADKEAQAERRREAMRALNSPMSDVQHRMMIVLGEFSAAEDSMVGKRVIVKHMPETPLLVEDDVWTRLQKAFQPALQARSADPQLRLIIAALIYARRDRIYLIDRASLMLTTETWIPVEDASEAVLIRHLTQAERSFLKPLRYDSKHSARFPNVKLLDTGEQCATLDIVDPMATEQDRRAKLKALQDRPAGSWVWDVSQPMPPLPPKRPRISTRSNLDATTPA